MNARKLRLESLEERNLLAVTAGGMEQAAALPAPTEAITWWVATAEDTTGGDDMSLRDALAQAKSGDTVKFFSWLSGETITLSGKQLSVPKGVTVDASDLVDGITINAGGKSRVFSVSGGSEIAPTVLKGLTITGGKISSSNGAGVSTTGTTVMLNCTVSGSLASNYCDYGGGIYNSGTLTMTNCTVSGNIISGVSTANYHFQGGGIYNSGTLIMTGCIVAGNSASRLGGGIYNSGSLIITNCIVSGNNSYTSGGGICNSGSATTSLTLSTCTIVNNTASTNGGGIYNNSTLTLQNTIVVKNNIYKNSGTIIGNNVISTFTGWDSSTDCTYYRSNLPLFTDIEAGDYTLIEGSIAINTGNNDFVSTSKDLVGNPRIVGGIVDIGAYEYVEIEPLAVPTITTGNRGVYVSYGANRHKITWDAVENASGYELAYLAEGGNTWVSVQTADTNAVLSGLTYGMDVAYRVRAIGEGAFGNSGWSETKTFNICPMDVNSDGDIGGVDRNILAVSWGAEEGDAEYQYYADINADGEISGPDRNFLGSNWGAEAGDANLLYPRPLAADVVFAVFETMNIDTDHMVF